VRRARGLREKGIRRRFTCEVPLGSDEAVDADVEQLRDAAAMSTSWQFVLDDTTAVRRPALLTARK